MWYQVWFFIGASQFLTFTFELNPITYRNISVTSICTNILHQVSDLLLQPWFIFFAQIVMG